MAQIPQYQSRVSINTPNIPQQGVQDITGGKNVRRMLDNMEKANEQMNKLKAYRQANEATALAFEKLNEQRSLSMQDMDLDYDKYSQEIDKIGATIGASLKSQEAKDRFNESFVRQAETAKFSIRNDFRRKEIQSAEAALTYQQENIVKTYPTMTDVERASAVANHKKAIDEGIKLGLYTKQVADIKYQEFQKDVGDSEASFDAQFNPDAFLEKKDEYDIDDARKKELEKIAVSGQKKIKLEVEKQKKRVKVDNGISLIQGIIDGNIMTEHEISQKIKNDEISYKFGRAYINALTSNITDLDVAADKDEFLNYALTIFESTSDEDIMVHVENILNGGVDGKVNQKEIDALLKVSMARYEELNKEESILSKIGKSISDSKVMKMFTKKVVNGEDPSAAKSKAEIEVYSEKNKDLLNVSKEGTPMVDANGNKALVFPDGSIKEIK